MTTTHDDKARELAPCPFCSWPAKLSHRIGVSYIECIDCGAEGPPEDNDENAIAAWNRRAAPAQQVEAEKWISVTERLPEDNARVIVTGAAYAKPDFSKGRYVSMADFIRGTFYEPETGDDMHPPTHWMPMPLPPAAGSNNGEKGK